MSLNASVTVVAFCVFSGFVGTILAEDAGSNRVADEKLVKTLTTNQVRNSKDMCKQRIWRNQEFVVCRIVNEKRNELTNSIVILKEFGISPDKAYHFEAASKKLYELLD